MFPIYYVVEFYQQRDYHRLIPNIYLVLTMHTMILFNLHLMINYKLYFYIAALTHIIWGIFGVMKGSIQRKVLLRYK